MLDSCECKHPPLVNDVIQVIWLLFSSIEHRLPSVYNAGLWHLLYWRIPMMRRHPLRKPYFTVLLNCPDFTELRMFRYNECMHAVYL